MKANPFDPNADLASLCSPEAVEREKAAYALHKAQAFPETPEPVENAERALTDLLSRTSGWDGMKRDDRRLSRRYLATIKAGSPDLVAHARDLGLLDSNE